MASRFMIGTTAETIASLDALATPLPDPQAEYRKYRLKVRLGNGSLKGRGLPTILWEFPLLEVAQQTAINAFQSNANIFIQSPDIDDVDTVYEVQANWGDPRESGGHKANFSGYRFGLTIEFNVISEVEGS